MASDVERGEEEEEEEEESASELLRDRFRLCTISIAETEEQLARDVELFAQHAGRKSINMEDVILSAHRNDHLSASLRSFSNNLKAKEPQSDRKRKKITKKEDKAAKEVLHIDS
ncbi:protein MHF1 homolog isoform X2 [Salvia hispanica]|uniref:protein MHF1 homolog isoform X2 n=1 Tax=Salvia hispanica TaxID=49212 RepID=UPI0020094210|nr:protein MHF1 homolog isoform X2 [Salvia hispanica]